MKGQIAELEKQTKPFSETASKIDEAASRIENNALTLRELKSQRLQESIIIVDKDI